MVPISEVTGEHQRMRAIAASLIGLRPVPNAQRSNVIDADVGAVRLFTEA